MPSFHFSGKVELIILWLQMYVKLSDIYGAANFSNLGPILSVPVALVISIFFRYFSTFSCAMLGMEKDVFSDNLSLQNILSVSKLEETIGSFISEATDTKNLLNSVAISLEFSIILSLTFKENMLVPVFRLLAPSSLKSFQTLLGLLTFSLIISEYCCFFRKFNHFTHFISPYSIFFMVINGFKPVSCFYCINNIDCKPFWLLLTLCTMLL